MTPASVKGENLKYGSRGHELMYDTIMRKEFEEIGRKYGSKLEKTAVTGKDGEKIELWRLPITEKMRKDISEKGQPLYQAIPAALGLGELIRQYKDRQSEDRAQ